jgi:hypothetical protein
MARRKFNTLETNNPVENPGPVVKEPVVPDELPAAFRGQAVVHKPNQRGRFSAYQPLFIPPGVKVALRLAPQAGNAEASADYKAAKMEGWAPATPDQVTDDVDKAKADGLIAMLTYDELNGQVRVGPYVLMWRPYREWYKDYIEGIEQAFEQQTPGVQVEEQTEVEEYALPGE